MSRHIDISPQPIVVEPGTPFERIIMPGQPLTPISKVAADAAAVAMAGGTFDDEGNPQIPSNGTPRPAVLPDVLDVRPVTPTPPAVKPPSQLVSFKFEVIGTFEVAYHQVIRERSALVLVYDTAFSGGVQYDPPMGVTLKVKVGKDEYTALSAGLVFTTDKGLKYTVLVVQTPQITPEEETEVTGLSTMPRLPVTDELGVGDALAGSLRDLGIE